MSRPFVTRFAPSPSGRLHLGHGYSALTAWRRAEAEGGRFILRIEDIDAGRCHAEFIDGIYEDLAWLGIKWETPVRLQSQHMDDYAVALAKLADMDLLYPCFCTRRDIREEIARSPAAPHGPEGAIYPGICRALSALDVADKIEAGEPFATRLNMEKAISATRSRHDWPLTWQDENGKLTEAGPESLGDVVLARKDIPTSYHMAVVVDDALQGISHVIRGQDLLFATHLHCLLQALLGLDTPVYHHHRLLTDDSGARLAKRDRSQTIESLRDAGNTPDQLITGLDRDWGLPRLD